MYPASRGGAVANDARKAVEKETGQSVVLPLNAKQIAQGEVELLLQRLRGIGTAPEDFDYKEELENR